MIIIIYINTCQGASYMYTQIKMTLTFFKKNLIGRKTLNRRYEGQNNIRHFSN